MAALALENVGFTYNSSFHLTDISLKIKAGELTGIIGPNGSGKSTLVKIMAGYIEPAAGAVLLAGKPLAGYKRKEVARKLAVVSQGVFTDFDFTVEEMVALGRLPHLGRWRTEGPEDKEAVDWALAITGLEPFRTRSYNRLSGGEAQRVMVAQALAQQPEVLLLDEPTTYLDMAYQREIFNLLTALNKKGITIAAVLHDVNMAALYCGELIAIKDGRIFAQGSPEAVITRENILAIYGSPVEISAHPTTGRPQLTLLP